MKNLIMKKRNGTRRVNARDAENQDPSTQYVMNVSGFPEQGGKMLIKIKQSDDGGEKEYKVIENLGFVHDIGMYAKVVMTENGERKVVKDGGKWRFWTSVDRTQPLRENRIHANQFRA